MLILILSRVHDERFDVCVQIVCLYVVCGSVVDGTPKLILVAMLWMVTCS